MDYALEIAIGLVKASGAMLLDRWGKEGYRNKERIRKASGAKEHIIKAVTDADYRSQEMILEGLVHARLNTIGLLAEEDTRFVHAFSETSDARWVLDGLDGTFNFAMAHNESRKALEDVLEKTITVDTNLYGINLGIQCGNEFLLSVIYLPSLDLLYTAKKGEGAQRNGVSINVSPKVFSPNDMFALNSKSDYVKNIFDHCIQPGCPGYCITRVAEGGNIPYLASQTFVYDFGPPGFILEEAGGHGAGLDGLRVNLNRANEEDRLDFYFATPSEEYSKSLTAMIRASLQKG